MYNKPTCVYIHFIEKRNLIQIYEKLSPIYHYFWSIIIMNNNFFSNLSFRMWKLFKFYKNQSIILLLHTIHNFEKEITKNISFLLKILFFEKNVRETGKHLDFTPQSVKGFFHFFYCVCNIAIGMRPRKRVKSLEWNGIKQIIFIEWRESLLLRRTRKAALVKGSHWILNLNECPSVSALTDKINKML